MPKTVLIVDDSRMSRMMISTIIKTHHPDWSIIDAASGEEALDKTKGKTIDLMTLDMNMPGMDGITLGSKLRVLFPDAHIALVTANIQDAVRQKAEQAKLAFIAKPITEDRIMDYVKSTE
jgi:CheY-like chemotaxis protein